MAGLIVLLLAPIFTIVARSQVGQGATFIVTLPMRHPKLQAPL